MAKHKKDSLKIPTISLPAVAVTEAAPLPGLVIPLFISKKQNIRALEEAETTNDMVVMVFERAGEGSALKENLSRIGGLARIVQRVRTSSGDIQVTFHIIDRVRVLEFSRFLPSIRLEVEHIAKPDSIKLRKDDEALVGELKEKLLLAAEYDRGVGEHLDSIRALLDPGALADLACSVIPLTPQEAQIVVEELDPRARLKLAAQHLNAHINNLSIKERISKQAEQEVGIEQHQEMLREQIRLIRAELGENDETDDELEELTVRVERTKMPAYAKKEAEKQLRRLKQFHPDASEAALVRTYLDWLVDVPWTERTKDQLSLKRATEILEEDHFGLKKPKDRIVDFLAVRKLKKDSRGPILLFLGPPGVGKTSLGRSIARTLGRKFVRISLGGLRDEAELRGHRRTYVGAMPGRIVQALKNAGTKNPVCMLDEIDKIGSDFRGDPASVLLEVLDPEQNCSFEDHYLNIPYDLSEVMFICTANVVDSIPRPLLDRMEIIELSGYTTEEKIEIAKRYILPQELEENGLNGREVNFSNESLLYLVDSYTRESGVRELRRQISGVFRKVARSVAEKSKVHKLITPAIVKECLGTEPYLKEEQLRGDAVGVVTGLAWTSVGGELLTLEVSVTRGKGLLSLTGQLGEVMRESGMTALTYVLSRADELGIDPAFYDQSNIHVHVPHGGIPKDGPSAGVAITTALVSALTGCAIPCTVAMTGEVTLRGNIIEIGGLKEKALAARRAGVNILIFPKENERELIDFPDYLLSSMRFVPVSRMDEVFEIALSKKPSIAVPTAKSQTEQKSTVKKPLLPRVRL